MTELIIPFIILSAFLNAAMVMAKVYFDENKIFKKLKPALPPLVGGLIALIAGFFLFGTGYELWLAFPVGFLSGTFSTSSYEIFEKVLKTKAEEI